MSARLSSRNGVIAMVIGGVVLVLVAGWFLLVSPERSRSTELDSEITAQQQQIADRRAELARPSAAVRVRVSDIYRLSKAIPDDVGLSGIVLDVNRLAGRHGVRFVSIAPGQKVIASGYTVVPLSVVLEGRFNALSKVLREIRRQVAVKKARLKVNGRLYSVDEIVFSPPEGDKQFPDVKLTMLLNAFVNGPAPVPADPAQATEEGEDADTPSTPPSDDGTVAAAGATP